MKKLPLIGGLLLVILIGIAIRMAFETGERSPFFASGTVSIDPQLQDKAEGIETFFIIIFDEQSQRPMPFGAMKEKLSGQSWPLSFAITKEKLQTMMGDQPPKSMRLKVRLDRDGVAGPDQHGDITGEVTGIQFGAEAVAIKLDRLVE